MTHAADPDEARRLRGGSAWRSRMAAEEAVARHYEDRGRASMAEPLG